MTQQLSRSIELARRSIFHDWFLSVRHARPLCWLNDPAAYIIGTVLLKLLSFGTMLVAPRLLTVSAFGNFSLLTTVFQYGANSDLGLSQLADRELAVNGRPARSKRIIDILRARWIVSAIVIAIVMPVLLAVASRNGGLPALDAALALLGGTTAMVSGGPVTLYRASSQIWEFTALALSEEAGLTAPRLAGLAFGGITGCFAVLLIWYAVFAAVFARPLSLASARLTTAACLLRHALPLFAFSGAWMLYLTANRWISAWLSHPSKFGLFAFGANLASVALGTLGAMSQVRYPKLISHVVRAPLDRSSVTIERELHRLGALLTIAVGVGICTIEVMIRYLFPDYQGANQATAALAVSCVPLGLVAWVMPALIALSPRPQFHAGLTFAPAVVILFGAMAIGNYLGERATQGIDGQAWGCAVAAVALFAIVVLLMGRLQLVHRIAAVRLVLVQCAVFFALWMIATTAQASEQIVFSRDTPEEALPPAGWEISFEDNFRTLEFWDARTRKGIWQPYYPWGGRTNRANRELQFYVDPRPGRDPAKLARLNPFSVDNNGLSIVASEIPPSDRADALGQAYASGLLSSAQGLAFTYGYFEIRARIPAGKGLWPTFWLLPTDRTWPPEIDVFEVLGDEPRQFWVTLHSSAGGKETLVQTLVKTPDLSAQFHRFALKWTPEDITWFFDTHRVAQTRTPADLHKPMYLLINLAVGGKWPGAPDSATAFPARFDIGGIRVFRPPSAIIGKQNG